MENVKLALDLVPQWPRTMAVESYTDRFPVDECGKPQCYSIYSPTVSYRWVMVYAPDMADILICLFSQGGRNITAGKIIQHINFATWRRALPGSSPASWWLWTNLFKSQVPNSKADPQRPQRSFVDDRWWRWIRESPTATANAADALVLVLFFFLLGAVTYHQRGKPWHLRKSNVAIGRFLICMHHVDWILMIQIFQSSIHRGFSQPRVLTLKLWREIYDRRGY